MMGSENNETPQNRLLASTDVMESVVLDQSPRTYLSNNDYKGLMSSNTSYLETHPLSSPGGDPLDSSFGDSYKKSSSSSNDPLANPPSYAYVDFTPYVGEPVANGSSREEAKSFTSSGSSSVEYLKVLVSQPQKEHEITASLVPGGGTYVTYLISTRTNIPEFGAKEFSVRRRFRDVVTLADRLSESYRGSFIPPRPDKSIVESQVMHKEEFVEQRRAAVEKYLGRLAAHPVLRRSKELMMFLQVQGKLPLPTTTDMASRMLEGAAKLPRQLFGEGNVLITSQDVVQPAKGGRDLIRMFKELKQYVTSDWGGTKPCVVEEDKDFLERKGKLQNLEHQLSEASQQAEALVKAQQELGETMGELGLAFIKLAKFENEEAASFSHGPHAGDMKRFATAAVKASRFYREANAQSVRHLDQLHEYLGLMQAIHTAFVDRSNALLTVQTLMSELSSMNSRVENLTAASSKIFGGDKTRNRKAEELRDSIKITEEARDCAMRQYEHIKENNKKELRRFDTDRQNDFFNMLKGFVQNQVAYAEKIANVWMKVAEESSGYAGRSAVSPVFGSPAAN